MYQYWVPGRLPKFYGIIKKSRYRKYGFVNRGAKYLQIVIFCNPENP